MTKYFITGGAGFIGSAIARQLVDDGEEVVVYDSFVQYISPLESNYQKYLKKRFEGISKRVKVVRGDTRNKVELKRVIMAHRPDIIIHLAALPIADLSNTHTEEALTSIIHGTVSLLDIIRDVDFIKRFVYTSSSMIYGDFEKVPANEDHPKRPKDIYGGTKLCGEILTQSYSRRFGIEYAIVRPSAVYGPTDVNRRVSQIFLEEALKGEPLTLHDGYETKLDFTYIKDVVQGFILVATSLQAKNEVFNITRGEGRSLMEYVEELRKYFPDLRIKNIDKPVDMFRPKRGALDISKARSLLGYSPEYSLKDGVQKYVQFMRQMEQDGSVCPRVAL